MYSGFFCADCLVILEKVIFFSSEVELFLQVAIFYHA